MVVGAATSSDQPYNPDTQSIFNSGSAISSGDAVLTRDVAGATGVSTFEVLIAKDNMKVALTPTLPTVLGISST